MERFVKFACYCRRTTTRSDDDAPTSSSTLAGTATAPSSAQKPTTEMSQPWRSHETENDNGRTGDGTRLLWDILERVLLWEDFHNSFLVFLAFNAIFWIIVVLDLGGFATICSIAGLMTFWCWAVVDPALRKESEVHEVERSVLYSRVDQFKQMGRKMLHNLGCLRNEQPGLFCILACSISVGVWLLGHIVNGILLIYVMFMIVLLGPALLLRVPVRMPPTPRPSHNTRRESDSEIEEFLPAATETNIQILAKAGEVGEYSPTPTSALLEPPNSTTNEEQEFLNDGDLMGHKMPSHEDGSSDGLELSDLELTEKSSTSSSVGQSDSEFEIIDQRELSKLDTPQDSTL